MKKFFEKIVDIIASDTFEFFSIIIGFSLPIMVIPVLRLFVLATDIIVIFVYLKEKKEGL